jgi:hypothetical protein
MKKNSRHREAVEKHGENYCSPNKGEHQMYHERCDGVLIRITK